MTIHQLHKICTALIAKGAARRKVCVSKETFTHPLESDGATILDVVKADLQVFTLADDDGGTKVTSRGVECSDMALVFEGGERGGVLKTSLWIESTEHLPAHFHGVLGWISDSEPYCDKVSYDPETKLWHHSTGLEDEFVTVTHWMPLPYDPAKKRRWS